MVINRLVINGSWIMAQASWAREGPGPVPVAAAPCPAPALSWPRRTSHEQSMVGLFFMDYYNLFAVDIVQCLLIYFCKQNTKTSNNPHEKRKPRISNNHQAKQTLRSQWTCAHMQRQDKEQPYTASKIDRGLATRKC